MNDMWGNGMMGNNNNSFPRFFNNNYNALPHYELIKVNGEESAKNFRMAPNSDALLLDEKQPILYHVQTDGAGYLTVNLYDLIPHQSAPQIDINQLNQRVAQLEEIINARQSNFKQQKKQQRPIEQQVVDTTN